MKAWEATFRKTQAVVAKKRANTIFGSPYVNEGIDDDDDEEIEDEHPSGEVYHTERILPNGDNYIGHWSDNFPHGHGKYWWTDGCMYAGEWFRGKKMGKGTFSWPSGAIYEGNFKSGFMDGEGVYSSPYGDTYRGSWMMNFKHGHGTNEYANGDCYEGEWIRGLQDGHGRYKWRNGNSFIGEWKNGSFFGKGTMCWTNSNVYEGYWEDGLPKGNGTFRWSNGSVYVGFWSKDPNERNGTYFPAGSMEDTLNWDPQEVYNVISKECVVGPSEKIPVLPSNKKLAVWRSAKANNEPSARPRRLSVDGRLLDIDRDFSRPSTCSAPEMIGMEDSGGVGQQDDSFFRGSPLRVPKLVKKQGETIKRGHKNYELMLNLQLGVRHSVGKPGPPLSLDLKPSAFDPKEKYWTKFPSEGSKHTPPHPSCEFKWKDYCPKVFRTLRMLFKVDAADYMLSICGNDALRELCSPGKSGSFFYLTNDDRYMIKTMKKAEVKVLLKMLSAYYSHVRAFENTLVTRYFGLHCVKLTGQSQRKVRFVIMGNLFCTEYTIHRRYDLKGSTFGRITEKPDAEMDATTTLKDLDLNFIFKLQKNWFQDFVRQVDKDCEFLEQEGVMDYSLLVGLHFVEAGNGIEQTSTGPERWASTKLGVSMPARVERTERPKSDIENKLIGDPTGEYYDVVIFFGIIDILQDYDLTKKLEHAYKSIQYDPNSISAVDPRQYSRRFRDYIFRVFAEDT